MTAPSENVILERGLRDRFAAAALTGLVSLCSRTNLRNRPALRRDLAWIAYEYADAMIEARALSNSARMAYAEERER